MQDNGAVLHGYRLSAGRSSVAHNPRLSETIQCPPRILHSPEHSLARLRRCGDGVASSGHVLQAHGSDVLLRRAIPLSVYACGCCKDANRSGQILSLHTHRLKTSTRKISWTDLPRVYHAQANARELKL